MDYPKRILIVGNGGRENALANALLLSDKVEQLYITPANWGVLDPVGGRVKTLEIKAADMAGVVAAASEQAIDLAVVGPEDPLAAGLADQLRAAGVPTVGPGKDAAQLEGSKLYAKEFMARHGMPTAAYHEFSDQDALLEHCRNLPYPSVLKADGLAAGKGVILCESSEDAVAAAERMMVSREFGAAGDTVVVEELLRGVEISFTCLVSGEHGHTLHASTDYKPLKDGNQGPNTGGMGNMCPTPYATPEVQAEFEEKILKPFMQGLKADGLDYRGFLFVGTMLTDAGLKVLEFNVRFGDPEAQVVLPMCKADWPKVFVDMAQGSFDPASVTHREGACVAVVLASGNYPYGKSEPAEVKGLDRLHARGLLTGADPQVAVYFAGVSREASGTEPAVYANYFDQLGGLRYLATGGRVLAVSARGEDLSDARRLAYECVGNLHFDGMQLRSDIGKVG